MPKTRRPCEDAGPREELTEFGEFGQSYFRLFFLQNAWKPDTNALFSVSYTHSEPTRPY